MNATDKITGTPEGRPGIWLIDSDTAASLIKAAPGDAIHNLLGSGLLLLGASWDKQAAIEHVQREDMRLALVFPPHLVARHHLVAINDEKRWAFDVGPLNESMMVAMEERRPVKIQCDLTGLLWNAGANRDRKMRGWYQYGLAELHDNLRELRERTSRGDMAAVDEFFGVYVFSEPTPSLRERADKGGAS